MAAKESTKKFYEAVRKEYERQINIKELGVQKYTDELIRRRLAKAFFREVKTIEDIIFMRRF